MSKNTRYFQWLIPEKKGEVQIFDKIIAEDGIVYIGFTDGSRINEEYVAKINQKDPTGKIMAEIDSPSNQWGYEDIWIGREEEVWETNANGDKVCVQPLIEGKKALKLIPPKPTNPNTSKFGVIEQTPIIPNETIISDKIVAQSDQNQLKTTQEFEKDPVYIMISKSKKIDQLVEMEMEISLPSTKLYNIIKELYEEGEEKILEYIIQDIDVNVIKNSIKNALRVMYENS